MNSLAVLAVLAVTCAHAMPPSIPTPGGVAGVPQFQSNTPGLVLSQQGGLATPFVQVQAPFLAQVPGVAGQPATFQHVFPLTSYVVRPLSEAEQNAIAHQEFQRIWEAQAIRNLAIPQLQATVAAKQAGTAASQPAAAPTAAASPSPAVVDTNTANPVF